MSLLKIFHYTLSTASTNLYMHITVIDVCCVMCFDSYEFNKVDSDVIDVCQRFAAPLGPLLRYTTHRPLGPDLLNQTEPAGPPAKTLPTRQKQTSCAGPGCLTLL